MSDELPAWDEFYTEVADPHSASSEPEPLRVDTARQAWETLVPAYGIERVWSIVEPDDAEYDEDPERFTFYALAGVHVVNVLYYVVSTEPVRPEHTETDFTY